MPEQLMSLAGLFREAVCLLVDLLRSVQVAEIVRHAPGLREETQFAGGEVPRCIRNREPRVEAGNRLVDVAEMDQGESEVVVRDREAPLIADALECEDRTLEIRLREARVEPVVVVDVEEPALVRDGSPERGVLLKQGHPSEELLEILCDRVVVLATEGDRRAPNDQPCELDRGLRREEGEGGF